MARCVGPYAGRWIAGRPRTHPAGADTRGDPGPGIVDTRPVRGLVLLVVAACGSTVPAAPVPVAPGSLREPGSRPTLAPIDRAPVDPIGVLATDGGATSLLQPGAAQLELHATPIDSPGPTPPIPVTIVAEQGSRVRVAVRLARARFVIWTERARLYALLLRDQIVSPAAGRVTRPADPAVMLRAGSAVKRLAHHDTWTQVRFSGAVEVEGWVPDAVLGEEAPSRPYRGRIGSGRKTLMVMPGAVIRAEPTWAGPQLAVMANGYFLDIVREVDEAWSEISYGDGDVTLSGFVSRRDPPGRVHRKRADPALAPVPITPNTRVASGTCLYARGSDDPIGYLVGDQDVDLAGDGRGEWALAIDTPWGPIAFAARGPDPTSLVACAPDKAVPPSTLVAPPPPTAP